MFYSTKKSFNNKLVLFNFKVIIFSMIMLIIPVVTLASTNLTQTIHLKTGWNAIYLEVFPEDPDPDIIFKDSPVTQVLTMFADDSSVQFIKDPEEMNWKNNTWFRWVPSNGPEAILKTLYALNDNQGYIVYANEDYTLTITGQPAIKKRQWQPDAFNLFGFYVDPVSPPTFAQYFAESKSHQNLRVFSLIDGIWRQIQKPDIEIIESGKAYWVYCEGGSDYSGPLQIDLPGTNTYLNYGRTITEWDITFTNRTLDPLSVTVTPIPNNPGDETAPLSTMSYTQLTIRVYEPFMNETPPMVMEAGQSVKFRLAIRRDIIISDLVSSLIKISDDLGNRFFVPVIAEK